MSEQKINPQNVTKPIQLLAAWLVGLILINSSFLAAANLIEKPDWAAGLLVVAAVINVPIFLGLIFFLQTKFRAELQEDTYYSKHLENITGEEKNVSKVSEEFLQQLKNNEKKYDNKLEELSKNIDSIALTITKNIDSTTENKSLFEKLDQAKNTLSEVEVLSTKQVSKIALNDLIPNYQEIAKDLVKSGYKISKIFGSTSKEKEAPKHLVISFTDELSKSVLSELYPLLKNYGFTRIHFSMDDGIILHDSDLYIGSYIDEFTAKGSLIISSKIEEAIFNNDISIKELGCLITREKA